MWESVMKKRVLGGLLICGLFAGCAGEPADRSPDAEGYVGHAIINGTPANGGIYNAVVGLHQRVGDSAYITPFCSGTLVTEDVVITAAHCLDTAKGGPPKAMDPLALAIYVGNNAATDPSPILIPVAETAVHSGYNRSAILNDVAAVRLAFAVPASIVTPVPHLPASLGFTSADIGINLNFAGFGIDENNNLGVKLETDLPLGGLGCTVYGCPSVDDPATQISYVQDNSGPCSGDSGGPAFINRNGTTYLAGLTSYGDYYCYIYGVSTRTDAFEGWINNFIGVAPPPPPDCSADGTCNPDCAEGADPDCAPEPPPAGSCGDGVCGEGESCDGRYGTIACSDCPGKYKGKIYCYVEGVCEGPDC